MKRSELFFSIAIVPLDFLMLLAGFWLAYKLREQGVLLTPDVPGQFIQYGSLGDILPLHEYLQYVLYIVPVMLVIFALTGLYATRGALPWSKRIVRIFLGVTVGLFFILFLSLLRNDFFLPRSTVIYAWVFSTVFVVAGRVLIRLVQWLLRKFGIGVIRLGIIAQPPVAARIMSHIVTHPNPLHRLDFLSDRLEVDAILRKLDERALDELIVVNENYSTEDLIRIRNRCIERQVSFSFIPMLFVELMSSSFTVRTELGLPALEVRPTPLEGWGRVWKRVFDIVGSLVLIILFSPLYLIIAIWMKLASPGPLIFKNERLGKYMKPIKVWKFRSMEWDYCDGVGKSGTKRFQKWLKEHPEAAQEWAEYGKLKDDPRVSLVGRFLRKTSLDELPQFFNVLAGTMSLVGPRPIVRNDLHDEVAKYGEAARLLFTVKPGVTGLWQVSGRSDISFAERVELDVAYIENWSIWKDLVILLRTVAVFLPSSGRGGY